MFIRQLFLFACVGCTEVQHFHCEEEPTAVPENQLATEQGQGAASLPQALNPVVMSRAVQVHVLGIESVEGDDEFAHAFSRLLREAAATDHRLVVADSDVTLAQMALAEECLPYRVECLHLIASRLSAENLVIGVMHRRLTINGIEAVVELTRYNDPDQVIVSTWDTRITNNPSAEEMTLKASIAIQRLFLEL